MFCPEPAKSFQHHEDECNYREFPTLRDRVYHFTPVSEPS